jgi:hypothetical protein
VIEAGANQARIRLGPEPAARHVLLKALIDAGFKVSSFAPHLRSLEELYFEEVDGGRKPS